MSQINPMTQALRLRAAALLELRRRAAAGSLAQGADPDPVTWIEREFYIPERQHEDNPAMPLADYQRAVIREAHRTDPAGNFIYDLILWSDVKKSAKSSIAAAVILYRALRTPYGSFKVVANDLKQADSRVFYYARRAIELNPRLRALAEIKNYKITLQNRAVIEAVPVDPSGEAGGNDDFIEFTELHAASSKASQRMWAEMTIPPTKHGKAQRWIDTYAGHTGEAPILEQLYQDCVKPENLITELPGAPADLEIYRSGSILCLWNTKPRLTWQNEAYYTSEARILPPAEFDRMHRNHWVTSASVFVPPEWWLACRCSPNELYELRPDDPMVVGIDAGVASDCFAVVGITRRGERVTVRTLRVWQPDNKKLDFAEPESYLRSLHKRFNVIEFCYDPYQLHDMATRMRRDGLRFREFNQGQDRLIADKQLYDAIRDRRIQHDGNVILTTHVENANAVTEGEKMRLVKRAPHLKIDAAVALSMAHARIMSLKPVDVRIKSIGV